MDVKRPVATIEASFFACCSSGGTLDTSDVGESVSCEKDTVDLQDEVGSIEAPGVL